MLLIVKNDKFAHQPNGFWHISKNQAEAITEVAVVRDNHCVGVFKVEDMLYSEERSRAVFDIAYDSDDLISKRTLVNKWRVLGGKFTGKGYKVFSSIKELVDSIDKFAMASFM